MGNTYVRLLKCQRCGKDLPENSSNSRKYCYECAKIINLEKTKERDRKKKPLHKEYAHKLDWKPSEEDRQYCKGCIYANLHSWHYLCNYYIMTGIRRGCKAGAKCNNKKNQQVKFTAYLMR